MTAGLPLMKTVLILLPKSIFTPLGLTAAASATGAVIQKTIFGSGLLIKGVSKTIKNKAKKQKRRFLPMLLGTLAASVLRSALSGRGLIRAREATVRAGQNELIR